LPRFLFPSTTVVSPPIVVSRDTVAKHYTQPVFYIGGRFNPFPKGSRKPWHAARNIGEYVVMGGALGRDAQRGSRKAKIRADRVPDGRPSKAESLLDIDENGRF